MLHKLLFVLAVNLVIPGIPGNSINQMYKNIGEIVSCTMLHSGNFILNLNNSTK